MVLFYENYLFHLESIGRQAQHHCVSFNDGKSHSGVLELKFKSNYGMKMLSTYDNPYCMMIPFNSEFQSSLGNLLIYCRQVLDPHQQPYCLGFWKLKSAEFKSIGLG